MRKKIGISVVIPNWDGKKLLERNLPPLIKAMDYYGGEYEIIVVDNASKDRTVEICTKHTSNICFLLKPCFVFFYQYFLMGRNLDGFRSFFTNVGSGFTIFMTYAKLWEKRRKD